MSAIRGDEAVSAALIRKARQLAADPVLRRWTVGHVLGRYPGEPPFTPHRPPYLNGFGPLAPEPPETALGDLVAGVPSTDIALPLPGETARLRPGDADDFVRQSFADIETALAVHRFAWLPVLGDRVDPAWVQALWSAWRTAHGELHDGWAWHPYAAAERAINVLRFARRHGLPGPRGDALAVLAAHGPAITARLEYFGDHHTSNHLANDGRGLFQLGLALNLPACADLGGRILVEEAKRIFSPSSVLREGSSHYHLLLTRNYADAWLAARTHGRSEEEALRATVSRALAAASRLVLPAGVPLVGDISPDCPPDFLGGLLPGVALTHHGFARIGGVGAVGRHWRFALDGFSIADQVDGNDDRTVARSLVTPLPVERGDGAVVVRGRAATYRVSGDASARLETVTRWHAYGDGEPATLIRFEDRVSLPWSGTITVDVL